MIILPAQPQYDAYWNAYRRIRSSGLTITTHPVTGPMLAQARALYVQLQQNPQVGFDFVGFHAYWLNVAQHVAHLVAEAMDNPPLGVDRGILTIGIAELGNAVGVDLVGQPVVVAPIIPGMLDYMDLV